MTPKALSGEPMQLYEQIEDNFKTQRTRIFTKMFEGLPPTYRIPKKKDIQVFMVVTDITPDVPINDYIEFYRENFNEDVKIYKE